MSQQEFESQKESTRDEQTVDAQPYYWSTQRTVGGTKEEHPATFEESIPPYGGYTGQEAQRAQSERQSQRQEPRPVGEFSETGYRPPKQKYTRQQVPTWAQPQRFRGRSLWQWIGIVALVILAIKLIPILLVVVGIAAFIVLLPILLILGVIVAFAVIALIVLSLLGVPLHRSVFRLRGGRAWRGGWGRPWN